MTSSNSEYIINDPCFVDKTDVIKKVLFSLVNVSTPKSSKDYAWSIIKTLLTELREKYDFLKYIEIDELDYLKNTIDDIKIKQGMNRVAPRQIGKAIQDIIDIFKTRMGTKAGYHFISEFKENLGEEYHTLIKKMGVDLRLIDLQNELVGMMKNTDYKIKEDSTGSNIAFLEKQ